MSNARRLQTDIDKVMKKIDEGVELFDEIWEKVYAAEQQNQKEKYEADLKKEIKKLQRLRDQIKSWIGSSDVKDKDPLIDARKLIETKMEQFKICEKETKTKTYSKEGLARQERLDPAEAAKRNSCKWIQEIVDQLNQLVEDREAEIERLSSGRGKKTNRHTIEEYNEYVMNHKFHINKLEGIMRLVMNDLLDVETIKNADIKSDLEYYLESYDDPDYRQGYDEEYFYEALGLNEMDVVNVDRVTIAQQPKKLKDDEGGSQTSSKGSKSTNKSKKSSASSVIPLTIGRARSTKSKNNSHSNSNHDDKSVDSTHSGSKGSGTPSKSRSSSSNNTPTPTTIPAARPAPALGGTSSAVGGTTSMAAILKRETEQQEKERQKARQAEQLRQQQQRQQQQQQQEALLRKQKEEAAALRQQQEAAAKQQEALRQQQQAAAQQEALKRQQQQQQQQAAAQQQQHQTNAAMQAQQQVLDTKKLVAANGGVKSSAAGSASSTTSNSSGGVDGVVSGLGGLNLTNGTTGAMDGTTAIAGNVPSVTGMNSSNYADTVAAAAAAATQSASHLKALSESFATMPTGSDSERARHYTPQNPYATHASYPATPSSIFENPAVFEKLGTDCLFFIFYYAQGTYQQYLAARELKKQSWRFHKKYMTWFQRHEEPKVTTEEYEQGTYVYFDYETGWCTRIKQDFRFEYSYLEDQLQ